MMGLKKVYRDELLQIAIIVSLLRVDPNSYLGHLTQPVGILTDDVYNDSSWSGLDPVISRRFYIHPKCVDSVLLDYERDIFEDLNALGRYNRTNAHSDITAYLLNVDGSTGVQVEPSVPSAPAEVAAAADDAAGAASLPEDEVRLGLKDVEELTQEVGLGERRTDGLLIHG